jgi:hypothetical protein
VIDRGRVGFDISAGPNLVAHHAGTAGRNAVREVYGIEEPVFRLPLWWSQGFDCQRLPNSGDIVFSTLHP